MESLTAITVWLACIAAAFSAVAFWGVTATAVIAQPSDSRESGSGREITRSFTLTALGLPAGRTSAVAGAALLVFVIVSRWQDAARPPWTNMWEFTVAFAASVAVAYVVFERVAKPAPAVGGIIQTVVVLLLLTAIFAFSSEVEPLVPALQSEGILAIHVGFMVVAYGALSLSFGAALLRLAAGRRGIPSPSTLDGISRGSVVVGFPLLTVGILLGAYWANDAWGRYWGWDPKETAALVTWLIYAGYLHIERLPDWRGPRTAAVLIGGYVAVLFTYFGVNLWISGLHSYT